MSTNFGLIALVLLAVLVIGLLVLALRRPWTALAAFVALLAIFAVLAFSTQAPSRFQQAIITGPGGRTVQVKDRVVDISAGPNGPNMRLDPDGWHLSAGDPGSETESAPTAMVELLDVPSPDPSEPITPPIPISDAGNGLAEGTSHYGVVVEPSPKWNPRSGMLDYHVRTKSNTNAADVNDEASVHAHGGEALLMCLSRLAHEPCPADLSDIHNLLARLPAKEWRDVAESLMSRAQRSSATVANVPQRPGRTDWTVQVRIPRDDLREALDRALRDTQGSVTSPPSTARALFAGVLIVGVAYVVLKASTRRVRPAEP